ncbi:MAG: hypothetical protein GY896_23065 [Gammaproteobacteria bacterium]|nr:hypothetical protein [Gammaproteobacteria bacterium]
MPKVKANRLKKTDLLFIDSSLREWLKRPEAQGFGKVASAQVAPPWAHGPRVRVGFDMVTAGEFDALLFYFRKKVLGYEVVAVWTIKPRERIWPIDQEKATAPA